jgi:hypothetical protein
LRRTLFYTKIDDTMQHDMVLPVDFSRFNAPRVLPAGGAARGMWLVAAEEDR